jgi:HD-GYP domain-containing protein (c-di-GMP phosphodiesterase class II)/MFS family permease
MEQSAWLPAAGAAAAAVWGVANGPAAPDVVGALAAAVMTSWLMSRPLRVSPNDHLPLVLAPALCALGLVRVPWALAGMLGGLAVPAAGSSRAHPLDESLSLIAGAGIVAAATWGQLPVAVSPLVTLGVAAVVYAAVRTMLAGRRLTRREHVQWTRAMQTIDRAAAPFLLLAAALALGAVAIDRTWLQHALPLGRSLLPLVTGAIALHIFHPYSVRGEEEQRVLATTEVLAEAIDVKDPSTGLHSVAVARLSKQIARVMAVNERIVQDVFLTGLLHDVGKVTTPDAILLKPAGLDADELAVMRRHVVDSAAMVASISGLASVAPMVGASHEHYNGSGYPAGLRGEAIPIAARIVAVADTYHALTSGRPYRAPLEPVLALQEIERHSGAQFDPRVVGALKALLLGRPRPLRPAADQAWLRLFRQPRFSLLWGGELVSSLGDEVFFIAITLWVYTLTGSAGVLAAALGAGYAGQALFSVFAGALADRVDRRLIVVISDVSRAAIVAALPFVLPRSLPAALVLLALLNIGSAFFKSAVNALVPSLVSREDLGAANALYQTTERIAEILGGVLGAAAVLALGYHAVMFADAASFLVSAVCVSAIPVAWRAGLRPPAATSSMRVDLAAGFRYVWHTPFQRAFALLIIPGYLTLAFEALRAPMVLRTAHLSAELYGALNSVLGIGRLVTALALAWIAHRWASPTLAVAAYLLTGLGVAIFTAFPWYAGLLAGAFLYAAGNMLSLIVNTTIVMQATPPAFLGRVLGNRQVLVQGTRLIAVLALGRLADVANPPVALWTMVVLSIAGVLAVSVVSGRALTDPRRRPAAGLEVTEAGLEVP